MNALVDQIYRDHQSMRAVLDDLEASIAAFADGDSVDLDKLLTVFDYCAVYPDLGHHQTEDAMLEVLRARKDETVERLAIIETEHMGLSGLVGWLIAQTRAIQNEAEVSRDHFVTRARDFILFYRQHMNFEEEQFLPFVTESFAAADWQALDRRLAFLSRAVEDESEASSHRRALRTAYAQMRRDVLGLG